MLKIAVCDDNKGDLDHVVRLLKRYQEDNRVAARVDTFQSAMAMMDALRTESFDLLILDILMPGFSGIQAAREIRSFDTETKILFLTSSAEFAVESYRVDAFYYLLKPVETGEFFGVLDRFLAQYRRPEDSLLLTMPSGLLRLPISSIEVLEINSKQLLFYLNDGSLRQIHGTLTEYEPQLLSTGEFIKVHRSYLVNMDYILQLKGNELVTSSGKQIPVSRLLANQVRKEYMDFLFRKEGDGE